MKRILIIAISITMSLAIEAQETATFGGGCFWCTEAVFSQLKGVSKVESGYSGGELANPTYREVCTGLTGHAEVIQITFNPQVISFTDLLEVFFATHDPTTLNRQGADVGTQYRSVVFYHNEEQRQTTVLVIRTLNAEKIFDQPIVTDVSPMTTFYTAEGYHQDYFANNASQPYCRAVIVPKMDKFKKLFKEKVKE